MAMTTTAATAITAISHPLSLVGAGVGVGVGVGVDVSVGVGTSAVLFTVSVAVEAAEMFPAASITNR